MAITDTHLHDPLAHERMALTQYIEDPRVHAATIASEKANNLRSFEAGERPTFFAYFVHGLVQGGDRNRVPLHQEEEAIFRRELGLDDIAEVVLDTRPRRTIQLLGNVALEVQYQMDDEGNPIGNFYKAHRLQSGR